MQRQFRAQVVELVRDDGQQVILQQGAVECNVRIDAELLLLHGGADARDVHVGWPELDAVACKNRERFIELLMAGVLASAEIIIVHSGEIVMDQRIGMDHLDCSGNRKNTFPIVVIRSKPSDAKAGAYALASIERAVTHRLMDS